MVTTKLKVFDNGDLELPTRPRRRLMIRRRRGRTSVTTNHAVPQELELSTRFA